MKSFFDFICKLWDVKIFLLYQYETILIKFVCDWSFTPNRTGGPLKKSSFFLLKNFRQIRTCVLDKENVVDIGWVVGLMH